MQILAKLGLIGGSILFLLLIFVIFPKYSFADLSYEIPYTLVPTGEVYCDNPPYDPSIYFQSYRVTRGSLDGFLFQTTTLGNGLCTGSFQALTTSPGNFSAGSTNAGHLDGSAGIYYLIPYLQNNFTEPYGYMAFDCPDNGACEPLRLTTFNTLTGQIDTDTIWTKDNNPYIVDRLSVSRGATLTINPGVVVKFRNYISFLNIDYGSTLNINGTPEEKVVFTSIKDDTVGGDTNDDGNNTSPSEGSWNNVKFFNNSIGNITNAVFQYGDLTINNQGGTINIANSEMKTNKNYGILQNGGFINVSNSKIHNNYYGIYQHTNGSMTIHNSSIVDNSLYGAFSLYNNFDATNNFWGDLNGPYHESLNYSGLGNAVSDNIEFIPWLTEDPTEEAGTFDRPVLIVPGVLGTDILKDGEKLWLDLFRNLTDFGDEFMDPLQFNIDLSPSDLSLSIGNVIDKEEVNIGVGNVVIFDYTNALMLELQDQGYTQGIESTDNLFLFPYDWRYGINENNINSLKQKIEEIKSQTGSDKVDVIAHSAGGLLVKKYAMNYPENNYINKAVFVGVPNTGSPQAVKNLVQGSNFSIPWLSDVEMKKIAKNMPMVYDLLPSQQYFNSKGSYIKTIGPDPFVFEDLDFEQSNNFLINDHDLNNQALNNSKNLHSEQFDNFDLREIGIDLYSINGCRAGTLGKVIERRTRDILGNITITYDEPERVPGDDTVPLESATNLPINQQNKYYALKTSHPKMLSQNGIRQQIVNIISGSDLEVDSDKISQDISECKLNGKAIAVFSPLDIEIVDQEGNYAGLSQGGIQNDIPNADFHIMGHHKFVYLPTDDNQTYSISLKGTGEGTFTLKSTEIVGNEIGSVEIFGDIPVTDSSIGMLDIEDQNSVLSFDNDGDSQIDIELTGIPGEIVYMPYVFSGFLQPINDILNPTSEDLSVFKAGSTVPVKFQLRKYDGTTTEANQLPTWLSPQRGSKMTLPVDESIYVDTGTTGNELKWDSVNQQYIYNWSTKGLSGGYWYKISVKLDDGNIYSVKVGLK